MSDDARLRRVATGASFLCCPGCREAWRDWLVYRYFERRINPQPRWWDGVVSPIRNAAGNPERILASPRDVTTQKISEDALRDATQFDRTIIEDAGEGIIVYDRELRYKVLNPFMERLTGKRAEEVLGKVAIEIFPRLGTSGVETTLRRALDGEVVKISDVLGPKPFRLTQSATPQFPRFAHVEDADARSAHPPRRKVYLYKRPNSSLWQCSTYLAGKNRRISTKEESFSKAKEIAEDWYVKLRAKLLSGDREFTWCLLPEPGHLRDHRVRLPSLIKT